MLFVVQWGAWSNGPGHQVYLGLKSITEHQVLMIRRPQGTQSTSCLSSISFHNILTLHPHVAGHHDTSAQATPPREARDVHVGEDPPHRPQGELREAAGPQEEEGVPDGQGGPAWQVSLYLNLRYLI